MTAIIECRNLTRTFGSIRALDDLSITIPAQASVGLVGPNGAGKTTLFAILCGFLHPGKGSITVLGHKPDSARLKGHIGILPQDIPLMRGISVHAQLFLFARLQNFNKITARQEIDKIIQLVNIGSLIKQFPETLSYGQRKRITLAQALIGKPDLILLDEPTSGLDPVAANDTLDTILMEIRERATKRIKGPGIRDDAVRIFFSGITTSEIKIYNLLEDLGGTLAGLECVWNLFRADVNEDEEPFIALAKRDLSIPFTQPMTQRAKLVTGLTKQMKADGSIFDCAFGCNYIAKTARCITDNIRMELNIPTTTIDTDLPGENRAALEEHLEGFLEIVRESKETKKLN